MFVFKVLNMYLIIFVLN